jgi:hypothetical protein
MEDATNLHEGMNIFNVFLLVVMILPVALVSLMLNDKNIWCPSSHGRPHRPVLLGSSAVLMLCWRIDCLSGSGITLNAMQFQICDIHACIVRSCSRDAGHV